MQDPNMEVLDYFDRVLIVLERAVLADPFLAHRIILGYQAHQSCVRTTYRHTIPTPPATRRVRPPFARHPRQPGRRAGP